MTNTHCIEKKIYYHDTDCGGVVYYANYLKYLEEARTEFLLSRGVELTELAAKGVYFVVAHTELDYKYPARYQDIIQISATIENLGRCSIDFIQEVVKGKAVLVKTRTTLVCVNKEFKPAALPSSVKDRLHKTNSTS